MVFWWKKKRTATHSSHEPKQKNEPPENRSQKITPPSFNAASLIGSLKKEFIAAKNHRSAYAPLNLENTDAYKKIIALTPKERADFLVALAQKPPNPKRVKANGASINYFMVQSFAALIRKKLDFKPEQIADILEAIKRNNISRFEYWPIGLIIGQLGKSLKTYTLTDVTKARFAIISNWAEFKEKTYYGSNIHKARVKLLGFVAVDDPSLIFYPLEGPNIGNTMKAALDKMSEGDRIKWYGLFQIAATATGSRPNKKITTALNAKLEEVGVAAFKEQVRSWLEVAASIDGFYYPKKDETRNTMQGSEGAWGSGQLNGLMQDLLKGIVWAMSRFHDEKSLSAVSKLAEKCFERLPGIGPSAPALGNACIYTLASSKGLSGVAHLSRLKMRVKQNNTQKLIQKNIEEQAARLGLKPAEIEDMAAPDFGLELGIKSVKFKDYTLRVDARQTGQAVISWIKPDGKLQKSVPSFVKDNTSLSQKLKTIRAQAKDIKKASTAQRDRIDRLYTEDMSWDPEAFAKYYLDHGLIGPMARKLIWLLTINGKTQAGLFHNGVWQNQNGKTIKGTPEIFQLWHPIMSEANDILAWRSRLEVLEIKQPFKQSFREVYLLTDAEINTKVYSNRMAAHILKQHQFNALSAIRGWKYSLMGAYDDGRENEVAQKSLPAYGLIAQFWIDELMDETESFNDSGIWDYVATDQIRFTDMHEQTVDLVDIPPIILSEILRDADLFVGVASVGNDPTWADRDGAPRTNNYWHSYSFGDLSETAKTRKTVLESLLPRLKIRDKANIDGKFLVVKGTRHSYKIHIGSGNILITPTDRYLCIVPGRGKNKNLETLYLPFEGDRGLSIVLSKAFLLVADDKITDKTILSQL